MNLLVRWIVSTIAVAFAVWLLPGLSYDGRLETLFVVALMLGLVNALVRPVLKMLSCGLIVLTLGLILLVINGLMLWLTAAISTRVGFGFHVDGLVAAILGSVVISLVSWTLSLAFKDRE